MNKVKESTETCLKTLASLKFRMWTKYSLIQEDLYRSLIDLPKEISDDFEKVYEHFNVKISAPKEFDMVFRQTLWSIYYELYLINAELPKDTFSKVSTLIRRNPDAYPRHLLKYLKGKILSFESEREQINYCIDKVYQHLKQSGIDYTNISKIFNNRDVSLASFAFSVAGRLLELSILEKDK